MSALQSVLDAIELAATLEPKAATVITALVSDVKIIFGAQNRAVINEALRSLDAQADAAHASANNIEDETRL